MTLLQPFGNIFLLFTEYAHILKEKFDNDVHVIQHFHIPASQQFYYMVGHGCIFYTVYLSVILLRYSGSTWDSKF